MDPVSQAAIDEKEENEILRKRREFTKGKSSVPNRQIRTWPSMEDLISWSVFEYLVKRNNDRGNLKEIDIHNIIMGVTRRPPTLTHQKLYAESSAFRAKFLPHDFKE